MGVVRRVGEVLGLEAQAVVAVVAGTGAAHEGAVEEVPGVELEARLGGVDLEHAAARRVAQAGGRGRTRGAGRAVEDEVVVVAAARLLERADALADPARRAEVEGRPRHGLDRPAGDPGAVHGRPGARIHGELVVEDPARAAVAQVPVGVVREVHDGGGVAARLEVDAQRVVRAEPIGDHHVEVPRIALVAVGAPVREAHAHAVALAELVGPPDHPVEPHGPAVQVVRGLVRGEHDLAAVEGEAPPRDAVRAAADGAAEVGMVRQVGCERVEAEHHVAEAAGAVAHEEAHQARPPGGELGAGSRRVREHEALDGGPVGQRSEARPLDVQAGHGARA
jgi:hypothetical protein